MRQYLLPGPDQAVAIALFDMAAPNFLIFNDFYFLTDEIILKQLLVVTSVSVITSVLPSPLRGSVNTHQ
jgi:hypothetical protein